MFKNKILIRHLGLQPYKLIFQKMHNFTKTRDEYTIDEIWLVEHLPVFTQGLSVKGKNLLIMPPNNIPLIHSDRGGQITYHGPGQQIMYVLLDLKRWKLSVRGLIKLLEQTVINTLAKNTIAAHLRVDAPGVYVEKKKICSIGLKIYKGCSLHGLALNINMDLSPFLYINPCGQHGMKMTQVYDWNTNVTLDGIRFHLIKEYLSLLNNT